MSTLVGSLRSNNRLWIWFAGGVGILILAAISVPNLLRSRVSVEQFHYEARKEAYDKSASMASSQASMSTSMLSAAPEAPTPPPPDESDSTAGRKMIRTISLEMTVASPVEAAERIQAFAASLGGYIESSQMTTQDAPSATVTIRIPASKLDEARVGLRKLAIHVDSEKTDAEDVTKQYVDMDARLRNLRAEEAQYLTIMKSATKVQDMLDVSEKLSSVRGEIEQQQAEFATLSKQVETVALTIALRAPVATDALGFHWRPLYQLKLAAHDALDGLASYASIMTAVILYLPVILVWAATAILGAFLGWRVVRWVARALFGWKSAVVAAQ